MKSLILTATVALGLAFTANTADAQYRRSGVVYGVPAYSYAAPSYYGTSYAAPSYYNQGFNNQSFYNQGFNNQSFYNQGFYNQGYGYSNPYNGGYNGGYNYGYNNWNYSGVNPSGVFLGGNRIIRW